MSMPETGLILGDDGRPYCYWRTEQPEYQRYHDLEWGRPLTDDRLLFEKICLEGFQSGLAWITILRKREHFRAAFDGFDFRRVAAYDDADVVRLLSNPGIVRNRAKILSTINNARRACQLVDEAGSLSDWLWQFAPNVDQLSREVTLEQWRSNTTSEASHQLSDALKQRGWSFVGPTTMYAMMQAVGMINDHLSGCVCRTEVELAKALAKSLVNETTSPAASSS
ncbi:DNA-3-methyladenine glycosylase I [Herbaspirillum sp. Sphag1AN]|uniref:DNA-3-methyladenine glycosylase I n=1 Tax=unclassified Herbaspirillum TaxID=2624150 RepID=UPI0018315F89|nr:DNA-3-methyladenine glycosylase I [Herbaspirillum sp. Sphag1AN]MBB3246387.1 DNA-3-methyladenine glycosylase I [Herbaspirillum sp. Sphag64]